MKRRDFCKGLAVTLAAGALAPGAALPQAGAATALVGRAVPDDYYTLWYRSDRCSADLRHDYYYSDSLFDHAATEYDDKLALATLGMAAAADSSWESDQYYWMTGEVGRAAHIRDAFAKLGFAEVQLFNYTHSLNDAPDTVACAVARKTLVRGGRQVTIIGAFVRGSGYGAEWSGNLHAGSGSAHTGFVAAARQLTEKIRGYVQASAKRQPLGTLKLWMGGYSRAGGVTNLVAARLPAVLPQLEKKNTFVYTFAAPAALAAADCPELQQDFDNNHTASGSLKKNWSASNIFNIISSGDVVPRVLPAEWGFYRNGNDRFLPATVVPEELQALNDRSAGMEGAPLDFGRLAVTEETDAMLQSMMTLFGSLGEKISKTMDDAAALFKQGDYQQSIDMFARAWDLLPDSKYSYDESYLIVWRILIVALKANDTAVMKRWVKHIFLADPERADCGEREMWGARVAMACGDKEKAFQYIDVAMEKSHGRCFERSDTAIKEAYLNAR